MSVYNSTQSCVLNMYILELCYLVCNRYKCVYTVVTMDIPGSHR